jgi:hypothetical protein
MFEATVQSYANVLSSMQGRAAMLGFAFSLIGEVLTGKVSADLLH